MDTKFQDAIIQGVGKRLVSIVQDAIQRPSSLPTGTEPAAELAGLSTVTSGECCAPGGSATSAEPDTTVKSRVLKLGDGTLLHLADGDIPDPPAVSFVDDIPRLNGMWDDRTEHWQGRSVITIQGHPIAIEYWPLLYRYGRDNQWKGTKSKWTDYRVRLSLLPSDCPPDLCLCSQDIILRYRQGSPEQFWAEFSADGEHMKFTSIIQKLRDMRKSAYCDVERQARETYGPEFDAHFTYRRGGKEYVMTKPSAIAKRYGELTGNGAMLP